MASYTWIIRGVKYTPGLRSKNLQAFRFQDVTAWEAPRCSLAFREVTFTKNVKIETHDLTRAYRLLMEKMNERCVNDILACLIPEEHLNVLYQLKRTKRFPHLFSSNNAR